MNAGIKYFLGVMGWLVLPDVTWANPMPLHGPIITNKASSGKVGRDGANFSGSPYFKDEYKYASIRLASGRVMSNIRMKIDLVAHETHLLTANGIEAVLDAGMVKEINFADTIAGNIQQYKFSTGFPVIDRNTENSFYQVLAEGKCTYLKSFPKKVTESKNVFNGETIRDYETYEQYYLLIKSVIKTAGKDREFYLSELSDKQEAIAAFMSDNKINCKKPEQVGQLITYYNSL